MEHCYGILATETELWLIRTRSEQPTSPDTDKCKSTESLSRTDSFATPLHVAVHILSFQWTEREDKVFQALKLMLSQAPVVQAPDWSKYFHVFVNALNVAIGNVLMQLMETKWYKPVYYASQKLSKAEWSYSTTEWETVGMVYNVTKDRH